MAPLPFPPSWAVGLRRVRCRLRAGERAGLSSPMEAAPAARAGERVVCRWQQRVVQYAHDGRAAASPLRHSQPASQCCRSRRHGTARGGLAHGMPACATHHGL